MTAHTSEDGLVIVIGCLNGHKGATVEQARKAIADKYPNDHAYFVALDLAQRWYDQLKKEQEPKPSGPLCECGRNGAKFNRKTLKKVTPMKSSDLSQEITTISENSGERCHASTDGECSSAQCPQLKDNEPSVSGRHCPLDTQDDVYL
jgi:hypothetical protein